MRLIQLLVLLSIQISPTFGEQLCGTKEPEAGPVFSVQFWFPESAPTVSTSIRYQRSFLSWNLLLLFVLFPTKGFAETIEKTKIQISTCIVDYVKNWSDSGSKNKEERANHESEIKKRCLTPQFNEDWKKIVESTGSNPLFLSQDYLGSWATSIDIELVDPKRAEAIVTLGKDKEKHCLLLGLEKSVSGTLISSSKVCPKGPIANTIFNACPFECCKFGEWTARSDVTLFKNPDELVEVARIKKGEKVQAKTGEEHIRPILIEVTYPHGEFDKGDRIQTTHLFFECGLGYWLNGKEAMKGQNFQCIDDSIPVELSHCKSAPSEKCWGTVSGPVGENDIWWVKIITKSGKIGWTKETKKFDGRDSCS